MDAAELDQVMLAWGAVLGRASEGWPRDFAASIATRARNPRWRPSGKQALHMRKAVAELFAGDGELIEP